MTLDELQNFLKDPEAFKKIGIAPLPIRIGTLVILFIAVLFGGYHFIITKKLEKLDTLEKQEIELRQTFDRQQRLAANLPAYEEQLEEMRRSFGAMLRQLPDKTEVESLLVDLSQTSAANSLKVDFFKPSGQIMKEFYAEYPISLRVFGKYHELARFVSDIAALPRIVTLHDISIFPTDEKRPTELTMEMTAKTYHYIDESAEN